MDALIQIASVLILLILGYIIGGKRERKHYISLRQREKETLYLPIKNGNHFTNDFSQVKLISGSVVIGQDYFKSIVSWIKNIFGGKINSYETLLDRARREAILRLKEKAIKWGAEEITNLRVETSSIRSGKSQKNDQSSSSCEVFVYATAGKN